MSDRRRMDIVIPTEGEIHLWPIQYAFLENRAWHLSDEEKERQSKFKFNALSKKYAQRTGALRYLLAQYIDVSPGGVKFEFNKYGKPYLSGEVALTFNLSHSRDWFCLAIANKAEVGCDIEWIDESIEHDDLIEQYFSKIEQLEYKSFPPAERPGIFFNLWTRKEAFIKAVGQGLSYGLDRFSVEAHNTGHPRLLEVSDKNADISDWQFRAFDQIEGYKFCVAMKGEIAHVRLFDTSSLNALLRDG